MFLRRPKGLTQVSISVQNFTPRCVVLETSMAYLPDERAVVLYVSSETRHSPIQGSAFEGLPTTGHVSEAQRQGAPSLVSLPPPPHAASCIVSTECRLVSHQRL